MCLCGVRLRAEFASGITSDNAWWRDKYDQRMRSACRQPRQMDYNRLVPLAWIPVICLRETPSHRDTPGCLMSCMTCLLHDICAIAACIHITASEYKQHSIVSAIILLALL